MKATLRESRSSLAITSNPHANKAMVQMMAVFAEMERDAISKRTKEALAAAKARGVKLGNPRLAEAIETTNAARRKAAAPLQPMFGQSSIKSRKAASAASGESPRRYLRLG